MRSGLAAAFKKLEYTLSISLFLRRSHERIPMGPHGPRVEGPPSVTPNPPSWVEPSSAPYDPGSGSSNPGGAYVQPTYSVGSPYLGRFFPKQKTLWLAIPLAWFLGPFGLLYAIGDSKPQLIALAAFVAAAIVLHLSSFQPPVHLFHPILVTCAVWSVFAARAYNRRHATDGSPQ